MNAAMLRERAEAVFELAEKLQPMIADAYQPSGENIRHFALKDAQKLAHKFKDNLRAEATRLETAAPVEETPRTDGAAHKIQWDERESWVDIEVADIDVSRQLECELNFARKENERLAALVIERDKDRARLTAELNAITEDASQLSIDRSLLEDALAAKPAAVPEGWRLVPVKADSRMQQAAVERSRALASEGQLRILPSQFELWGAQIVWDTMLSAAPEAPAAVGKRACEHDWREFYTGPIVTHCICAKCGHKEAPSYPSPTPQAAPAAPSLDAASGVPVAWRFRTSLDDGAWTLTASTIIRDIAIDEASQHGGDVQPLYTHPIPGSGVASGEIEEPFPKLREVSRLEDMSQRGFLRVMLDNDGDVVVCTHGMQNDLVQPGSPVEFCGFGGGGGSPKTRAALLALMVAMEQENIDQPRRTPKE